MGRTSEFYFSQTLRQPLEHCGWKDIHETSFSLIKKLDGRKNAVLAKTSDLDLIILYIFRSHPLLNNKLVPAQLSSSSTGLTRKETLAMLRSLKKDFTLSLCACLTDWDFCRPVLWQFAFT